MSIMNNQDGHPLQRMSTDSGVASDDGSPEPDRSRSPYEISPVLPNDNNEGSVNGHNFGEAAEARSISIHSGPASEGGHIPRTSSLIQYQTNTNQEPQEHFLEVPQLEAAEEIPTPPAPSWQDFKQYFWHDGNIRTLIATSFCWFCVDLPFYGLGMNSPKIITTIWYGNNQPPIHVYDIITHNVWQSLIIVSLGAITGCAITCVAIDKLGRRNIQINGFFWLFILFVVIGGSFNHLYDIRGTAAIIVLYILCQIFFNFGMYSFLLLSEPC
jgi:MFS transporter, PHS family, inorganic phosphate transporter